MFVESGVSNQTEAWYIHTKTNQRSHGPNLDRYNLWDPLTVSNKRQKQKSINRSILVLTEIVTIYIILSTTTHLTQLKDNLINGTHHMDPKKKKNPKNTPFKTLPRVQDRWRSYPRQKKNKKSN